MLWLVLLKIKLARIAFAKRRAYWFKHVSEYTIGRSSYVYLSRYLFLLFSGEIDKMVIFSAN